MKTLIQKGAARPSRGLRSVLAAAKAPFAAAFAFARAWQWGAVAGRIALGALGLVVLGAIGRSALARNILSTDVPSVDAGTEAASVARPTEVSPTPTSTLVGVAVLAAPTPEAPVTAPASSPVAAAAAARSHATPEDPVYLNQATQADLHRLPGVGPKRAEAILALRAKLGHFRQIEDLLKVKGIGRSSLRKLRPLVRLDPPPPAQVADAGGSDARAG